MSWSIDTRSIARISSFEFAKERWESEKPWRNEHTSWRPLDNRRATHKRIVKLQDERGYECVLYNTPLVTYFTDGSVALKTYDSLSSVDFAYRVAPQGCSALSHKGRMFWRVRTDDGMCFYTEGNQALILTPTAEGNWCLASQPAELHQWELDRSMAAQVRKLLKPYADWYRMTDRLGGLSHNRFPVTLVTGSPRAAETLQAITTPERFMTIAMTYGGPDNIRPALYEAAGARYKAPVPHTSLPKEFA